MCGKWGNIHKLFCCVGPPCRHYRHTALLLNNIIHIGTGTPYRHSTVTLPSHPRVQIQHRQSSLLAPNTQQCYESFHGSTKSHTFRRWHIRVIRWLRSRTINRTRRSRRRNISRTRHPPSPHALLGKGFPRIHPHPPIKSRRPSTTRSPAIHRMDHSLHP